MGRPASVGLVIQLERVRSRGSQVGQDQVCVAADVQRPGQLQSMGECRQALLIGEAEFAVQPRRNQAGPGRAVAIREHVGAGPGHETQELRGDAGTVIEKLVHPPLAVFVQDVQHP